MISNAHLRETLLKQKLLAKKDVDVYSDYAAKEKLSLEEYIFKNKIITEEKLFQAVAKHDKLPFADLKNTVIRKDILFLVPEPIAEAHKMIAFDQKDKNISLAVSDPNDIQTIEFVAKKTGLSPKLHIAPPSAIDEALQQYRLSLKAEFQAITATAASSGEESEKELQELAEHLPIIRIVDSFLEHAIFEGASDIHIEPSEKEITVRYRIDGILRKVMSLPKSVLSGIVARIKILSNLKLDEHRLPQDGRFKIENKNYKISIRVSVLPIFDGEKIVMRLLDESAKALTLEELGFSPQALKIVEKNIKRPHGIILVTGPTGSGKTTTLYSILNILNNPGVNISTIEDPIEYKIAGVNQAQVSPKINFTFAAGLRALLRQDPNIIMVGEIRDNETADIAMHAALTGHLVLSTLHTNDAATTLPRLSDMGVPPFLIAFTTNMIIAQRLVRKICPDCKKAYKLDKAAAMELGKLYNVSDILSALQKLGVVKQKQLGALQFYRGGGCQKCGNSGYKGRIGIYEIMEVTPEIKTLINKKATADDIAAELKTGGMITIVLDGFIKAVKGITSIEEVMRVTKE